MIALIADPLCKQHDPGPGHPEQVRRFDAVLNALTAAGHVEKMERLNPRDITRDDLLLAHEAQYLRRAEEEIHQGRATLSTGDTDICAESWDAARKAAGSGLAAVDAVCGGKADRAFCLVRPPGHHASAARGMGFCVLNNIALAARHAQRRHGVGRVLIVDWDVHHGNGTQDIFYEDDTVFFFSTHQHPWYPGTGLAHETGAGAGRGATLNCPLPAGSGHDEIFAAFTDQLLPAMEKFRPELVLISAGFDSRIEDPLGKFRLTDDDFAELTRIVRGLAKGRVVSFLEGGYNLRGLASAATAHVGALLG
jgi:acetoin utilization deacetylase AcuC-like enzyme